MEKGTKLELITTLPLMPRRTRALLKGVPLHIVQRGHNREPCPFCEPADPGSSRLSSFRALHTSASRNTHSLQ
jgi:hypothetical protein